MDEHERWFFPELSNSYKTVFVMQVLACYILVIVLGYNFGLMWGAVAFALTTIKDCFVVTAMIQASRANAISEETQARMQEKRSMFSTHESRLLDRSGMDEPAPTLEIPGADSQDKW
jgi:hypothetical protein